MHFKILGYYRENEIAFLCYFHWKLAFQMPVGTHRRGNLVRFPVHRAIVAFSVNKSEIDMQYGNPERLGTMKTEPSSEQYKTFSI